MRTGWLTGWQWRLFWRRFRRSDTHQVSRIGHCSMSRCFNSPYTSIGL